MQIHLIPKRINIYLAIPTCFFLMKLAFNLLGMMGNNDPVLFAGYFEKQAGINTAMALFTFVVFITIPNTVYAIYKAFSK